LLERQFAKDDHDWVELTKLEDFKKLLVAFATRELQPITSREQFATAFQKNHGDMLSKYARNATDVIHEIGTHLPVFLWIADDEEAVFSIPTYGSGVTEFGFHTTDKELVTALARIWERYQRDAVRIYPPG
jgi:hypothetical protein